MYSTFAWGKSSKEAGFAPLTIERNVAGEEDVTFELKFCGICHTDIHHANNDMGITKYPIVPGHELAGIVTAVGSKVTNIKPGDKVGVGCISDSCFNCSSCDEGCEHTCKLGMTMTYAYPTKHGHIKTNTGYTLGGYSGSQTVNQRFIVKIPDDYPLEAAGPLFCAAITMYSPLAEWGAKAGGLNIGIIGIGGLGMMGVSLAKKMGNKVTAISRSIKKKADATAMGADTFIVSSDPDSMAGGADTLDIILNTVSAGHQMADYLPLLRRNGTLVQLGLSLEKHQINQVQIMRKKLRITGSIIGGMAETQECMDFCAKHQIVPKTKLIKAAELDEVFEALEKGNDQVIRYVLDIAGSNQ